MSKYGKEVGLYLEKVQEGDTSQLGKVFDLTAHHMRSVAKKYLINKSYCEDVVSDAFCRVLQYIHSYNTRQDGYNWLCKIVETTAYTYNEQEKDSRSKTVSLDQMINVGTESKGEETRIDVTNAIEILSPLNQEIIYDYFYRDLTYAEIAAKNHMAKSAIHKRIQKAFREMKKFLENGEQDE